MASVNVETTTNKWGLTHLVTGSKASVKNWCRRVEKSTPGRVLSRLHNNNDDGTVTWSVDVDNTAAPQTTDTGPGWVTCIAIGVGLGWLFGG